MGEFNLEMCVSLAASPDEVWAHASTMEGVNSELSPWIRMTVPAPMRGKRLDDLEVGQEAFGSVLLAFGFVPFDLHHLTLERVYPRGFDEESWTWMQRRWRHERRVDAVQGGCVVSDRLVVAPRFGPVALVKPFVRWIFEARHRALREKFGALRDGETPDFETNEGA